MLAFIAVICVVVILVMAIMMVRVAIPEKTSAAKACLDDSPHLRIADFGNINALAPNFDFAW